MPNKIIVTINKRYNKTINYTTRRQLEKYFTHHLELNKIIFMANAE